MKGFSKYDKMLGDFCGYDVLEALIYALQHGDDVVNGEDDFTYQASFAFVDYTPCIDTITAQCSIKSRTDFTFTIQYSNDVMEAVKVGKKPLVNESLCMLFDSIDDVIDSIIDCSAAGDMHKWLDMVAKKIRTEFIAAHAFIDANEEAQEAEKKIAEEQEAAKKANAEEKNTLTDSILKFIDHVYDYENGKYKDDKEFMENVKKDIKDLGSDAFTRIVDGLSGITKELSARLDELQDKMNSEKTETDDSTLKCYMADTGLLISHAFNEKEIISEGLYRKLLSDKLEYNGGMIVENIVAQMLRAAGHSLYFFSKYNKEKAEERMELDFLIAKNSITTRHNISPIEVKSTSRYTLSSLNKCIAKYHNYLATPYVLHAADIKIEKGITYLPLYMTGLL